MRERYLHTTPEARGFLRRFNRTDRMVSQKLQEKFDIHLEQKPAIAIINPWNRFVLAVKERNLKNLSENENMYEPKYGVIFQQKYASERTRAHELTHRFQDEINHDLFRVRSAFDAERQAVQKAVTEGSASYIGFETVDRRDYYDESRLPHWINDFRYSVQQFRERVSPLRTQQAWENIEDLSYKVGYFFTRDFVEQFLKHGISTGKALTILFRHPPATIADLANPKGYLRKLMRA